MTVWFVTGGLGSGKGLAAIGKIREYALNGNRIAGNLDVYLEHLCSNVNSKVSYTRVPDRPTAFDLDALGPGKPEEDYNEENNGLLVLDELVTWFNSRTWNDKRRGELIDWFVHARKKGWDIMFIQQSIEAVDKQLIDTLMGNHVPMSDLSQINVPILGRAWKHYSPKNKPLKLPKIHIGTVWYLNKVKADRWTFRAKDLYKAYDTKQIFTETNEFTTHSQLSRWHLEGRYTTAKKKALLSLLLKWAFYQTVVFAYKITRSELTVPVYKVLTKEQFIKAKPKNRYQHPVQAIHLPGNT